MDEVNDHQLSPNPAEPQADVRILGRILAAQNVIFALPDITRIAEYYAEILLLIPGISACRVCLEAITVKSGENELECCNACLQARQKASEQPKKALFDTRFACQLANQANIRPVAIKSLYHHFGFFVLLIKEQQIFNVYEPFISNLASYVAISLENRLQRDLLQQARDELERRVEERTQDLLATNQQLQTEIAFRKQTETALRESEQQITQLINNSPIAMMVSSGIEEHVEWTNDKFGELFGYTIEDMPDVEHWWLLAYPDEKYREEVKAQWQVREGQAPDEHGQLKPMEATVKCKDGSYRFVEFRYSAIGKKHLVTFVDLTERRRAEQELVAQEREKRTLLENIPDLIVRYDTSLRRIYVNPAWEKASGLSAKEVVNVYPEDVPKVPQPVNEQYIGKLQQALTTGTAQSIEFTWTNAYGTTLFLDYVIVPEFDQHGKISGVLSVGRDITERKKAEQALKESEERYRTLVEQASDGIFVADAQGNYLDVNPSGCRMLGYTRDEILRMNMRDIASAHSQAQMPLRFDELAVGKGVISERLLVTKDGTLLPVEISGNALDNGDLLGIVRDITVRKKAEAQLRASEQLFRALVENSPDFIARYDLEFRRIYINPAIQKLFGAPSENVLGTTPATQSPLYAPQVYIDHLQRVIETAAEDTVEMPFRTAHGEIHWGHMRFAPEFGSDGKVISVLAIGRDIHEIKENERRFRMLAENFPDFVARFDRDERVTYANPAFVKALMTVPEAVIGQSLQDLPLLSNAEQNETTLAMIHQAFDTGIANEFEACGNSGMGVRTFELRLVPEKDAVNNVVSVLSIIRDITERNQHELERGAIINVSNALRKATTRTEILTVILDQLVDLFAADGAMLTSPGSSTGDTVIEMGHGPVGQRFTNLHIPPNQGISNWVISHKQPYLNNQADADPRFYRPDLLGDSYCVAAVPLIAKEQSIGALWIARRTRFLEQDLRLFTAIADIAANALYRVTLYGQTETQLHHLMALHQIDIAITADFDLDTTLEVILDNVKNELEIDAASILLLTHSTQILEYAAGVGFQTSAIEQARLKLGSGHAGQAALEYRTVICPDLIQSPADLGFSALTTAEGFVSHFVTPLIVKGQVKGVLEVFQREPFEPGPDWLAYFETLATQTAIAIENASLFENLQRSNTELRLAYDATIEGWSRAMDLRDKETEGHTLRVTEMALRLADKMGMNENDKLNLRRGALLHDIGKMGVPDGILLKPGPLTDDEWKIMRQHPVYAFQMLSPIKYLQPALDIPCYHHEKWDGSGYPHGLKGETIPLAARVFAVIDVFDALIVDRPYRRAWPREKVLAYLQEQAGKHFDPLVVETFLKVEP